MVVEKGAEGATLRLTDIHMFFLILARACPDDYDDDTTPPPPGKLRDHIGLLKRKQNERRKTALKSHRHHKTPNRNEK